MFKRYALLSIGVAAIHGIIYSIVFMTWILGTFKGVAGMFFEVTLIILGIPIMFFINHLSLLVPSFAEFIRTAQHWCGDNNILYTGVAACNSMLWGVVIACLIYRKSGRR